GEDGFDGHLLARDVKNGKAGHPLVKVTDHGSFGFDQGHQLIEEHFCLKGEGYDLIDQSMFRQHADAMVLPQQILDNVEGLVANYIRVEKHHPGPAGHQPFGIVYVVAFCPEVGGGASEYISGLIQWFEFGFYRPSRIGAQHTVVGAPVAYYCRCLRPDNGVDATYLVAYLPRYLHEVGRRKLFRWCWRSFWHYSSHNVRNRLL